MVLLIVLAPFLGSCALQPRDLPQSDDLVVVKSCRLPWFVPWYTHFANHTWLDLRVGGDWTRVEILSKRSGVLIRRISDDVARETVRWRDRKVRVLAVYEKGAARMAEGVLDGARSYPYAETYNAWPGPNSNTFIDWLGHRVSGLAFEAEHNAVGKDYPHNGWFRVGGTTTRSGFELETAYFGIQFGLADGIELHVAGLTFGIGFWPPQLELPFLPAIPWGFF